MDKQRIQAYGNLILALLQCPEGQENEILQVRPDLVDSGLVQVMERVAAQMAEEGDPNASWLRRFAARLAVETSEASATWEDYWNFLIEVLQAVAENYTPEAVFPLLQQNMDKLDTHFRWVLQAYGEGLQQEEPETAQDIAKDIGNFSNRMREFPLGNRAINLEIAIAGYEICLTVFSPEEFPQEWAAIQNNLGLAYSDRIAGERGENLERALACYNHALKVRTTEAFPVEWAGTQNNLGIAYFYWIAGERSENIEKAISCYNDALKVLTPTAFPVDWATTQNNLGLAYSDRIAGEGSENIERAIACYNHALTVTTPTAFPVDWAGTQNNLGNAYFNRIAGEGSENIERAIACYNHALTVYTRSTFPVYWAITQNNLGNAYQKRIAGERSENIERAITYYREALTVRTPTAFPLDCLQTGRNLGDAAFTAGFWETAIEGYALAIEAVEKSRAWATTEERRQEILKESIGVFENMVQACVNTGQLDKALEYVERSRSKRLADLIAHNDLYAQGEIPPEIQEIIDKINQLQQQIDGIRSEDNPQSDRELAGTRSTKSDKAALAARNEEIAALEAEKLQLRQQLYKLDPAIAGLPLNFTQLQNLIDQPTTAILSFYTTYDHTHIFILRQNQITCHTCPGQGRKTLQYWIYKNWLRSYINFSGAEIFAAAKILRCRLPAVNSVNIADDQVVVKLNDGSEQFIAKPEFDEVRQQEKARLQAIWMKKMHPILRTLAQRLRLNDLIAQHLEGISELLSTGQNFSSGIFC